MKILFLMNGYSSKISGGDTHVIEFIKYLKNTGVETIVCMPKNAFNNMFSDIKVEKILYSNMFFENIFYKNNILLLFIYIYRIFISYIKLLFQKNDIIILSSHLFHDIFPIMLIKNKIFFTYVHHIIGLQKRNGIQFIITKILENASFYIMKKKNIKIFTVSEKVKSQLINTYKFDPNNIFVSNNGINISKLQNVKYDEEKKYNLVFCGRLHKLKGIFDLLDIIKILSENNKKIKCAVIGDGPEIENVKKIALKLNIQNNLDILGYLNEEDKIKTLKSSDIFILPSHEEGWGIVIAEALACRLPVITYKLNDITEIWKDNVVWCDCFDLKQFSKLIIDLLDNKEKMESIKETGYRFIESLDWDKIFYNEIEIIKKQLSN